MAVVRPSFRGAAIIAACATAFLTAGCASQSGPPPAPDLDLGPYADVHAVLDPATESIRTPMDAYFLDEKALNRIDQANNLLFGECLRASGRSFPPAEVDLTALPPRPDTSFGIWSPERAARLGYGFDDSGDAPLEAANQASIARGDADPGWGAATDACDESVERLPHLGRYSGSDAARAVAGPAYDVLHDAGMLSSADPRWEEARSEWIRCSEEHGLRFDPAEPHASGPEIPDDPEAAIRTAVVDVQCKVDTRLIEKLTSLRSQYEAALIDRHRTELDEVAEKEREVLERADAVIARHGAAA
jgi:hypothetical protein